MSAIPPEAAACLALAALALLPGLLVVRAPWTAVPALSLAFWVLAAWLPVIGPLSRERFVTAALVSSGLLALLRVLPKHEVKPPPGWKDDRGGPLAATPPPRLGSGPSALVSLVALAIVAPFPLWRHAPGPEMAFQTTAARLVLWRDGVPLSGEPLLPLAPFGAHAPALPTLAADVSRMSGLDPARAVLLVTLAAAGLLLVGLFALYATTAKPWAAAIGAVVGLALVPWPGFVSAWGEGGALVALAFGLGAAALLLGHASRSSAVAAGMLLAASALGQPLLAGAIAAAATVGIFRRGWARIALALGVALALALPWLLRLGRALSLREARAVLASLAPAELLATAVGLLLLALAPTLAARLARVRLRRWRGAVVAVAAASALLLVLRLHGWIARGQLAGPAQAALDCVGATAPPLEAVCAPDGVRDWVPALAGRPAGEPGPWVPPVYRDAWEARLRRPCAARLETCGCGR